LLPAEATLLPASPPAAGPELFESLQAAKPAPSKKKEE
jgi:hypothetical protein